MVEAERTPVVEAGSYAELVARLHAYKDALVSPKPKDIGLNIGPNMLACRFDEAAAAITTLIAERDEALGLQRHYRTSVETLTTALAFKTEEAGRLWTDLGKAQIRLGEQATEFDEELSRLREALEQIASYGANESGSACRQIARAALEAGKPTEGREG